MPPPAAEAASMVLLIAGVSRALPSPVAPKVLTSNVSPIARFDLVFAGVADPLRR